MLRKNQFASISDASDSDSTPSDASLSVSEPSVPINRDGSPRKRNPPDRFTSPPPSRKRPRRAASKSPTSTNESQSPAPKSTILPVVFEPEHTQLGSFIRVFEKYIVGESEASSKSEMGAEERAAAIKLHNELRDIIGGIRAELETASGNHADQLREDLELYMEQRRQLTQQLKHSKK